MNDEKLTVLAEITIVASLGFGIVLLFLMLTLFFRKVEEIERRVATPGKGLDFRRGIWGNGPIGRWMRILDVYAFLVLRHLPRIGPRFESEMGDELEPLPKSLKLWVIVPFTTYAILMFLFFFSGWYLGALD
ncbi:hypothetical protein [Marinobacter lutaoensis]|uniref:hypothetical protein n=1 Tax=Marinobacter lutaoensis TaxID=135739 RepID=UPI001593F61C|nr:hypothetical protein [Marinobacter lutaoensis]NVD36749.1 hypothetical protein [Marinobacter lutaoensis]